MTSRVVSAAPSRRAARSTRRRPTSSTGSRAATRRRAACRRAGLAAAGIAIGVAVLAVPYGLAVSNTASNTDEAGVTWSTRMSVTSSTGPVHAPAPGLIPGSTPTTRPGLLPTRPVRPRDRGHHPAHRVARRDAPVAARADAEDAEGAEDGRGRHDRDDASVERAVGAVRAVGGGAGGAGRELHSGERQRKRRGRGGGRRRRARGQGPGDAVHLRSRHPGGRGEGRVHRTDGHRRAVRVDPGRGRLVRRRARGPVGRVQQARLGHRPGRHDHDRGRRHAGDRRVAPACSRVPGPSRGSLSAEPVRDRPAATRDGPRVAAGAFNASRPGEGAAARPRGPSRWWARCPGGSSAGAVLLHQSVELLPAHGDALARVPRVPVDGALAHVELARASRRRCGPRTRRRRAARPWWWGSSSRRRGAASGSSLRWADAATGRAGFPAARS